MIKVYNIVIVLFISLSLKAQEIEIHGQVLDKEKNIPLPYANVMILNHPIGTTADKNGQFTLILNDSFKRDTLIISHVGFKSAKKQISFTQRMEIQLISENYKISEVVIRPSKNKLIILNNFKKSDCNLRYSIAPFDSAGRLHVPYRPTEPTIETIYYPFNPDYEKNIIKEIILGLTNIGVSESVFRLRILKSQGDLKSRIDLIQEPMIVSTSGKEKTIINVEKYNLHIPESGIFIGVELLIIPENQFIIDNDSGTQASLYSPFIYYVKTDTIGEYWTYSKGEWQENKYWF